MKHLIFFLLISLFFLLSSASAMTVLDDAITWAYTQKLTNSFVTEDFKPYQAIRRDEAAKFFVNFAKLIGKTEYVVSAKQCQFSDGDTGWLDLKTFVVESCRLGIFKGNKGRFTPNGILTNAQAVAVLMRIIDGYQQESWLLHWAEKYYERANALGLLTNVTLNDKEGLADRGNVVILLYNARKFSGTNDAPVIVSSSSPITLINQNSALQGDDLLLSQLLQETIQNEIKNLISTSLFTPQDQIQIDKKIILHYAQWCTTFWSGNTQVLTMTYGDTTTTSLQSIDLSFNMCNDSKLKGVWKNTLLTYAKWLVLHELGHYLYYVKDTTFEVFENLCWENGIKSCEADDFISEYAQTDKYEDYAEHFAYWYLHEVQQQETLRKPANPNAAIFQAKMKYFEKVFEK